MRNRFKIGGRLRGNLEALSKEAARRVTGKINFTVYVEGGCGANCKVTCAHYCHAQCEGFCGNISFKAEPLQED